MRDFLKGLELESETIDTIMAEHGKLVTKDKEEITNLTKKLDEANNTIKSFEEMDIDAIKKELQDYKDKEVQREADEKAAKEKSIRDERTNAFFNEVKFASESAKAGVIAQFNEKDFKYDEESNKFLGAKEWLEDLKTKDTGAFLSDVANPKFTTGTSAPTKGFDEVKNNVSLNTKFKNFN